MKSYTLPKYRRRFYKYLPMINLLLVSLCLLSCFIVLVIVYLYFTFPKPLSVRSQQIVHKAVVEKISRRPQTDAAYIASLPYGDLVYKIYRHESSAGKYDACKPTGHNGFGYGIYNGNYPCFSSFKIVAKKVSDWLVLHLQTLSVRQTLCLYNTGKAFDNCEYADYTQAL
jgi:hypothetical protein